MSQTVKPIPEGYRSVTPYITVKGGEAALEFYQKALGAKVRMKFQEPSGRLAHAEIEIGDSVVMMSDEFPEMGALSPKTLGGRTSSLLVYVTDVDVVFSRAIAAGGTVQRPVADQFYGDRVGTFEDPFGHAWSIATHVEDVSEEEMQRRMAAMKP
ncbi:MAG: VOC family protein [Burkholderiales bacterium]|nr:VOC family protein [Burkholderiales bacterium]